jgi:hypothetical protein
VAGPELGLLALLVILVRNLSLRTPLGLWLAPPSSWIYLYLPSHDHIFICRRLLWQSLRRSASRPYRRLHQGVFAHVQDKSPVLPPDLIRADVSVRRERFLLHSAGTHLLVHYSPPPTTLDDASESLPLLDLRVIDETWHSDNGIEEPRLFCSKALSRKHFAFSVSIAPLAPPLTNRPTERSLAASLVSWLFFLFFVKFTRYGQVPFTSNSTGTVN